MELIGAIRYTTEAAAHAADAFARAGRQDAPAGRPRAAPSFTRAGTAVHRHRSPNSTPTRQPLAARSQTVQLAAEGRSNAQMAERVVLSTRTVESHLYRAMQSSASPPGGTHRAHDKPPAPTKPRRTPTHPPSRP